MGMTFEAAIVYGVKLWSYDSMTASEKKLEQKLFSLFAPAGSPADDLCDIEEELEELGLVITSSGYEWNTRCLVLMDFSLETRLSPIQIPELLSKSLLKPKQVENLEMLLKKLGIPVEQAGFLLTNSFSP